MKRYERRSAKRIEKIQRIREKKIEKIKVKEKKVIKLLKDFTPGPGEYDLNYQSVNEKSPSVIYYLI